MKEIIQKELHNLANLCLSDRGNHRGYTDEDLFNATLVFQAILLDIIFTVNKGRLSKDKMLELAETTGKAIRELIKASTDKDMHEVSKNLAEDYKNNK